MRAHLPTYGMILLVTLTVFGCLSTEQIAPSVTPEMHLAANERDLSLETLEYGRHLYLTTCIKCHSPEPVDRYSQTQWDEIMPRMAGESNMNAEDEEAVTAYVRFILRQLQVPASPP